MNEKVLTALTAELGNNRGFAETVLNLFTGKGFDKMIAENAEELTELDRDHELRDYFMDIIYEWYEQSTYSVGPCLDVLGALKGANTFGECLYRFADLMVFYYNLVKE